MASVIAAKQTIIIEVYGISIFINFNYSVDKTFRVMKIMDFNGTGPTCYITIFPYANSGQQNAAFSIIVLHLTYIRDLILE